MRPFQSVGALKPRLTKWNLSYTKKFTTDMGLLVPIMCDECVPGDVWKIGNQCVIRFQPLLAPVLHEVSVYTHYFFVPYRLLWEDWEAFITGGDDGSFSGTLPALQPIVSKYTAQVVSRSGTLCDYLYNIVPRIEDAGWSVDGSGNIDYNSICSFPIQAYNFIWNEYYRDENVDAEVSLDNPYVLRRRWKKDYFTSALPWRQRGIAPALPVSTTLQNLWTPQAWSIGAGGSGDTTLNASLYQHNAPFAVGGGGTTAFDDNVNGKMAAGLSNVSGVSTSFDVNDLRLAFQLQKWLERSARAGARYTEALRAHFGVSPSDDRLQRPEYIGGTKQGVVFSEVLQTSATGQTGAETPQGNLAGHGLVADSGFAGKYRVKEYGLIMGIMSVVPKSTYSYGINRQWLRETRYDFYWPEFAHLGEQAIQFREIWEHFNTGDPKDIFGYQGRYDEMRYKPSTVHSGMRKTFDYWHLSREFDSCPHLNSEFLECNPSKRIFAVQDEDTLIVNFANVLTALRPIPYIAEPGLIDHN